MTRGKAMNVLNHIEEMLDKGLEPFPCEYGHLSCSYVNAGPCYDEAATLLDQDDDTSAERSGNRV
jgi:hypothetical protein